MSMITNQTFFAPNPLIQLLPMQKLNFFAEKFGGLGKLAYLCDVNLILK